MAADDKIVHYIRECRKQGFQDEAIRAKLAQEQVPAEVVEDSFNAARPKASWRKLFISLSLIAAVATCALLFLVAKPISKPRSKSGLPELTADEKARLDAEIKAFKPTPLGTPEFLANDLPAQEDGNAGEHYVHVGRSLLRDPAALQAILAGKPVEEARFPEEVSRLEAAVSLRQCAVLGILSRPAGLHDEMQEGKVLIAALLFGMRMFGQRTDAQLGKGDIEGAARENRKALAVSNHMMQEWGTAVRWVALSSVVSPILRSQMIRARSGRLTLDERIRSSKLLLQSAAFVGDKETFEAILRLSKTPATVADLRRYCADPIFRGPYCALSAYFTAKEWSAQEIAFAEPAAARIDLLNSISSSSDSRVAAIGQMGLAILAEIRGQLATAAIPERAEYYKRNVQVYNPSPPR